jgi:hypothetical protein
LGLNRTAQIAIHIANGGATAADLSRETRSKILCDYWCLPYPNLLVMLLVLFTELLPARCWIFPHAQRWVRQVFFFAVGDETFMYWPICFVRVVFVGERCV